MGTVNSWRRFALAFLHSMPSLRYRGWNRISLRGGVMDPGPVPVKASCKMCSQGKACENSASPGIGFARRGRDLRYEGANLLGVPTDAVRAPRRRPEAGDSASSCMMGPPLMGSPTCPGSLIENASPLRSRGGNETRGRQSGRRPRRSSRVFRRPWMVSISSSSEVPSEDEILFTLEEP